MSPRLACVGVSVAAGRECADGRLRKGRMMTIDFGLTELDRADLHARLVSWFGDEGQAFLVSHLAPVVDRIKSEACARAVAEFQWNALEMARKADQAERRAEDAEAELERLKAAADLVGHEAACLVDPCDCWMYDLAPLLDGGDESARCPDCAAEWGRPMREGCRRPWHHADEWEQVAETVQGSGEDAWVVAVFEERGCNHQWIDRPESDTTVCDLCGEER